MSGLEQAEAEVARLRGAPARSVPGEPDVDALATGVVEAWLEDCFDALGRLFVAGLAHPDPELPETLQLLAERGEGLGTPTATLGLRTLAVWLGALRPGPPDLASRTALARRAWDDAQRLLAFLRLFRADIELAAAALSSGGDGAELREVDVPRYTERVWIDGLALSATERLSIIGHDANGATVIAFDPLADCERDDLFGSAVISRLFQESIWLSELASVALDFERHPYARRGTTVLIQPAFRAVPRRVRAAAVQDGRAVERFEARASFDGEALVLRSRGGQRVQAGRTFTFNVVKRLADEGQPSTVLELVGMLRRDGHQLVAAFDHGRRCFPTVDARCWRVHPETLSAAAADGALALRVAASMFGTGESVIDDVRRTTARGLEGWFLTWWAARVGAAPPRWEIDDPDSAEGGFCAVWRGLWDGDDAVVSAFAERYAQVPEPTVADVCARALLLDAQGDRDTAAAYLKAHLDAYRGRGAAAPVLPRSLELLMLADTAAWLGGADRSGAIGDGLGLASVALRERAARQLYHWRVRGEADIAGTLALAAVSSWGATVIG